MTSSVPRTGLPVEEVVADVVAALRSHGAAVLVAPPGAGKTTLVPLHLAADPQLGAGKVVVLEPRRLATRAAARRMAELWGEPVGRRVGYRTRDDRVGGRDVEVEVVTEGILIRRLQADPTLEGTSVVVLDEIHERNLVTDLALALLVEVRSSLRPDLAVLAMSATVDAERVAAVLGRSAPTLGPDAEPGGGFESTAGLDPDAPPTAPTGDTRSPGGSHEAPSGPDGAGVPVLTSAGRQHPVAVHWWPPGPRDRPLDHVARSVVRALGQHPDGDALVFLPGAGEIARVANLLSGAVPDGVAVHPLHGSLPGADQDRALAPSPPGTRRVVLATDIAESSLTVDGVHLVVDAGLARSPRYDPATGLTRLVTRPASQASADQRSGRAGRLGPGVAIRLWPEAEHRSRPRFTEPEIAVVDLAGLALELAVWGSRPEDLALPDQPPAGAWSEAHAVLVTLGVLTAEGRPTALGRRVADLPLHPRLGTMVVEAQRRGHGWMAAVVAAVLDERDVVGGRRDDRSADLTERVALVTGDDTTDGPVGSGRGDRGDRRDPRGSAGGRGEAPRDGRGGDRGRGSGRGSGGPAVGVVRRRAGDLARRLGVEPGPVDPSELGPVVALAHPDRIAQARGGGRFRRRDGGGGWLPDTDPLAASPFLAIAEVDAADHRHARAGADGRIRLAAALDRADIDELVGDAVRTVTTTAWDRDRDDLRTRVETRAGALVLSSVEGPAEPGEATVAALLERVRATDGAALTWSDPTRSLQGRVGLLAEDDPTWPDLSDAALLADGALEQWLAPFLTSAIGRRDLASVDLHQALRARLDHHQQRAVDSLFPRTLTLPNGRTLTLDYESERPVARARVQDLFGTTEHPTVAGGKIPVVLHLLSPAGRPVQVTADLPGFWAGSWNEVRKEMAGRYPKHPWPPDPATAQPPTRPHRRR